MIDLPGRIIAMSAASGEPAPRVPEQSADTARWLAGVDPDGPGEGFSRDRERIPR